MRATFNREAFAALWNNHAIPTKRIAAAMGITRAGVSWHARNMGLPSREKVRHQKVEYSLLTEMWIAGVSSAEIAAHFGMSHHACASNAARKLGLPKRKKGGVSGGQNGGWPRNLPIAEFWERRNGPALAEKMMALAQAENEMARNRWKGAA